MNITLINEIQNEFKEEIGVYKKISNKTIETISIEELYNSKMWTAEFFDKNLTPFSNLDLPLVKLSEISNIEKGIEPGSSEYIKFFDSVATDYPFIKTSEIFNYELNYTTKDFIEKRLFDEINQYNRKGDIFYSKDGKVGQVAISLYDGNFVYGTGLVRIRLKDEKIMTKEFLFLLLSIKEFGLYFAKKYTVRGTTIPHLNIDYIKDMEIPIFNQEIISKYTKKIKKITNI